MKKMIQTLLLKSGWHDVYDRRSTDGRARSCLLATIVLQSVINGFSSGVFYSGLLVGYGISLVNISIISIIPNIASFFTLLTPYVLQRFPKRRTILTVTRIISYAVNILGITFLPMVVQSETGRVIGIVIILLVSNVINSLFGGGYSPWHMHYLKPEIRNDYFSSTTVISSAFSTVLMILISLVVDSIEGQYQLQMITLLRVLAFLIAMLDVYFMQKPKEPEYLTSVDTPRLTDIIRIPLKNKKFMMTELIFVIYMITGNMGGSVVVPWLLEDVKVGYFLMNLVGVTGIPIMLITTKLWNRLMQKRGTFVTLAIALFAEMPVYFTYAMLTEENYSWLFWIHSILAQVFSLLLVFPTNNLIYVNLPKEDQLCYTSFHAILNTVGVTISITIGAALVAWMGDSQWSFFGHTMTSPSTLLLIKSVLWPMVAVFVLLIRKKVEPDEIR